MNLIKLKNFKLLKKTSIYFHLFYLKKCQLSLILIPNKNESCRNIFKASAVFSRYFNIFCKNLTF